MDANPCSVLWASNCAPSHLSQGPHPFPSKSSIPHAGVGTGRGSVSCRPACATVELRRIGTGQVCHLPVLGKLDSDLLCSYLSSLSGPPKQICSLELPCYCETQAGSGCEGKNPVFHSASKWALLPVTAPRLLSYRRTNLAQALSRLSQWCSSLLQRIGIPPCTFPLSSVLFIKCIPKLQEIPITYIRDEAQVETEGGRSAGAFSWARKCCFLV